MRKLWGRKRKAPPDERVTSLQMSRVSRKNEASDWGTVADTLYGGGIEGQESFEARQAVEQGIFRVQGMGASRGRARLATTRRLSKGERGVAGMRALFGFALVLGIAMFDIQVDTGVVVAIMCYAVILDVLYLLARWRETR